LDARSIAGIACAISSRIFEMKRPHLVMDDRAAVDALISHWAFRKHRRRAKIPV
jgi:hypothetical protein